MESCLLYLYKKNRLIIGGLLHLKSFNNFIRYYEADLSISAFKIP